jgi:hypothetical protein
MTYIQPWLLTKESREAFLAWLDGEGLDAGSISNDGRFSVHNGVVAGNRFIGNTPRKSHFRVPQKHPLPELKAL